MGTSRGEEGWQSLHEEKLVDKVLERQAFAAEVLTQMAEFRPHNERVANIYSELHHLKGNLLLMADVMVQLDFAENWTKKYLDEVSACYYNNKQITIHPMVVYFKDNSDKIQHQSYVGISSETTHTAPTVMAFINELMVHVKILLPELRVVHFVSDSPSCQYRNRTVCAIVAKFFEMFAVKATGQGSKQAMGVSLQATIMLVHQESIATLKKKLNKWKIPAVKNIMTTHVISCAGDGEQLMRREIPCFHSCCHSPGGDFHFGCQGWSHAFSEPFIYRPIDESTRSTDLTTMELVSGPHTPSTDPTNIPTSSTMEIIASPPSLATDLVSFPVTSALVLYQANPTRNVNLDPFFPTLPTEMVITPLTSVNNSVPSVSSISSSVPISLEVPTLCNSTGEPDVRMAVPMQSSATHK
ncbi:hypothetical protein HOLleu_10361 [Holothuria leucospilota]|uniref:Uncharacterized protein n=1 Tax=Holothuria leucospilota TaxID=206669 RepID=A0A9Q1CET3_HOLLE|nr:hypothetical protein HOLleu_10361 [Holothuria leucospilota]